jgi:hypothetical protein
MQNPPDYVNLRKDTISGIIKKETIAGDPLECVFNEWWNGEGIDFQFDNDRPISLSIDQLQCVAAAVKVMGFIDTEEVDRDVRRMKDSWKQFKNYIRSINNED